ncbi:MAG: peroxiredoxin [Pseudobdellovibrionaceae bacterium]
MAKKATVKATTKSTVKSTLKKTAKKATVKVTAAQKAQPKKIAATAVKNSDGADSMLGKKVPSFKCLDSQGKQFDLSKQKGRKTVFYFYPKDDTPGCTIEGNEFSQLNDHFLKNKTDVFGISRDSVKSHDKFKCKFNFTFELLSDEDEKICKIFEVIKQKNMYGKMVMGIERSTFILDEDLKVIFAERKVKAEGHAQVILDRILSIG